MGSKIGQKSAFLRENPLGRKTAKNGEKSSKSGKKSAYMRGFG